MRTNSFAASLALLSASIVAHADTFAFTFGSSSDIFSGSGVLTTGVLEAPGEYSIIRVIGTADTAHNGPSLAISSILTPGTFPTIANGGTFPANDNTLFVTNGIGSLDGNGLAFLLSSGGQVNLYNPQGSNSDALLERADGKDIFENVPVSITTMASTPEPSSFALFGIGLLGVTGAVKRRLA